MLALRWTAGMLMEHQTLGSISWAAKSRSMAHLNSIHRNTLLCNHNTVRRLRIDERNEQIMIKRMKIHELERNVGKLTPQAEQHIPSAQVVYSSHCLGDDGVGATVVGA